MSLPEITRREALGAFASGAAALVAGCKPQRGIVPYSAMPEGMVPGRPLFFATSLPLGGAGRGVIVESHEGRPTKVHGNPDHPASLGGTDIFAEAEILSLFDPNRSRVVRQGGLPASWGRLEEALDALPADGTGVALLTGRIGSPTLARQLRALQEARPGMRLYVDAGPAPQLEIFSGTAQAAQIWPNFSRIDVVATLQADPLGPGPAQVAFAKGWSAARRARPDRFRCYALESSPSLTGLRADHRQPVAMRATSDVLAVLEAGDGEGVAGRAARALRRASGRAAVLPGPDLPPELQERVVTLNAELGAPLRHLRPFSRWDGLQPSDVPALVKRIREGAVQTLIVIGANPVHEHGAAFAEAFADVPRRFHFGIDLDETAQAATWHAPLHHPLEDWSDLRSVDGRVGLVQPLIAPLHDSRSVHEVVSRLADPAPASARDLVRATWRGAWGGLEEGGFEDRWTRSLHDGVVEGAGSSSVAPSAPDAAAEATPRGAMRLLARRSSIFDSRHAGNAWLQECPDPLTKQVWGNALWMSPEDAADLDVTDGDLLAVSSGGVEAVVPALVVEGQAVGDVALAAGYGRTAAGPVGSHVGIDAASLGPDVTLRKHEGRERIIRLQTEFDQHGRDLLKTVASPSEATPKREETASFYDGFPESDPSWGMVIDTDACIGCNACMIACQAENNIPVVGPDEAARGRHMHWMRVDAYRLERGGVGFQPVPCMHCGKAPCEPVCPVAASVHDGEGLNVQVYNRCIGTRFCQANCPYQVRRFNFFDYAETQAYADLGADLLKALRNPDVSVRGRGVMEKCTYCVQRISSARREAEKTGRPLADGDVSTACQSACPADAIRFGDLADPASEVSRARDDPRHYALLEELGTEPHTTYLARIEPDGEDGT